MQTFKQPMLETKEVENVALPVAIVSAGDEPKLAVSNEDKAKLESKATALRRACTALLVFALLSLGPWPSTSTLAALLAILSGCVVLCATSGNIYCRSRFARFLSFLVAVISVTTMFSLVSGFRTAPATVGEKVHAQCLGMPADTFDWGRQMLAESAHEHHCMRKGLEFLSRHMPSTNSTQESEAFGAASSSIRVVADQKLRMSQPEVCNALAHVATCVYKLMIAYSALVHLLLFLSAVSVVKRVCSLRCTAYKAGILQCKSCAWKRGKCAWKRPAGVTSPKELA